MFPLPSRWKAVAFPTPGSHELVASLVPAASPFGNVTSVSLDANGYVSSISNPAGNTTNLVMGSGGLVESLADPRGNELSFTYDADGREASRLGRAGNLETLTRTFSPGFVAVDHTTQRCR